MSTAPISNYRVDVIEVRSGDDLLLMVDLGIEGLHKKVRARLHGVDTPDAYKALPKTEAGEVRKYVQQLTRHKKCCIDVHDIVSGGWKVSLYLGATKSSECLNDILIDKGYVYSRGRA